MTRFQVCLLSGWFAGLSFLLPLSAQEEDVQSILQEAFVRLQTDIRTDTIALNELRARVEAERRPLAEELEKLRSEVAGQRRDLERIRELRTRGEREQAALTAKAAALQEERSFLRSMFTEYARALDTRMNRARDPRQLEQLSRARKTLADPERPLAESVEDLMSFSLSWNRERIGGRRFQGPALDAAGIEHGGSFATLGPVGYFASEDPDGPVGLVILGGGDQPELFPSPEPGVDQAIRALVKGEPAVVPVDATDGDAVRVAAAKPGWAAHLKQGGFTMIPLAGVALTALLLAVWKALELSRMRVRADDQVRAVVDSLRRGETEQARSQARGIRRPLRLLVDDLITYREAPREHLEEIMGEHVLASVPYVERNLGALAVLGGVAPLLGLLGTVTGMIHTFQLVTLFGSGDAKLLSGGISEALVTTETGLAIAIPTLLVHAVLSRRARGILGALETMSSTLVNDLKLRNPSE